MKGKLSREGLLNMLSNPLRPLLGNRARQEHEEEVVELMRHTGWSRGAIEAAFVLSSEMAKTTMLSTQEIWRAFVRPMLVESWRRYMASQTSGQPL